MNFFESILVDCKRAFDVLIELTIIKLCKVSSKLELLINKRCINTITELILKKLTFRNT